MPASRRVALITSAALVEAAEGLASPLFSVRREIILTARALEARGVAVQIVSLRTWPREQVQAIVEKADRIIFGTMLEEQDERAYRDAVRLAGNERRLAFFIGEHDAQRHAFYRDVAPLSQAWVVRSESTLKSLEPQCKGRVHVAPLPYESERGTPQVPRRSLRLRLGTAMAKRFGVGIDPWRLRLLWMGNASAAPSLLDSLGELRAFASQVPLFLHCLTDADDLPSPQGTSATLRIAVERRSPETVAAALRACDAVVLPDAAGFVDALNAGRFVIAAPHAEYEPFREFAWIGTSPAAGLEWLLRHRKAALRRVQEGQRYAAQNHSRAAISRFWMRALDFAGVERAIPLIDQARGEYAASRVAEAESLLGEAIQLDSTAPEAQHLLGNIYQDQGKADRAITCYRRALRLDPELAAAHNDLGTAYVAKGWLDEAVECYSRSVDLDPASSAARANLGEVLLKLGRRREALPHIRAAVRSRLAQLMRRTLKISKRRSIP